MGFIGSNFILYAHDHWKTSDIMNLDAISYGAVPENLTELENGLRYKFVKGNTADKMLIERHVSEVDVIVHFVAETHVDRSIADPESFLRSNVLGTFTLLEAARRSNIKKFVHISTDEVYGSIRTGSFEEVDRLQASSPYSALYGGWAFVEGGWPGFQVR
jgi:dTDP-glucose 4,6-dehydratase